MLDNQRRYELVIRPLGRSPADEYYHNQAIWVEGREGNRYTIDITNHTYARALFIVSVDGLDVLEGKTAGLNSQGYVLNGKETLSIPGWKINDNEAAEFYFSSARDSYVNNIGKDTSNTGVIGAMIFSEYVAPYYQYSNTISNPVAPLYPWDLTRQYSGTADSALSGGSFGSLSVGSVAPMAKGMTQNNVFHTSATPSSVTQEVGTGFGEATDWQTITTSFTRANPSTPDTILAVYYNTAKNLERMGIQLRRKKNYVRSANPFPGYSTGCPTPPNWKK